MAAGDITADTLSVTSGGGSAEIKPSTDTGQVLITNIYIEESTNNVEMYITDGTNDIKITDLTESLMSVNIYINSTHYIKIVNNDSSDHVISYDGIILSE